VGAIGIDVPDTYSGVRHHAASGIPHSAVQLRHGDNSLGRCVVREHRHQDNKQHSPHSHSPTKCFEEEDTTGGTRSTPASCAFLWFLPGYARRPVDKILLLRRDDKRHREEGDCKSFTSLSENAMFSAVSVITMELSSTETCLRLKRVRSTVMTSVMLVEV